MRPLSAPSTRNWGITSENFKKWLSELYAWLMELLARVVVLEAGPTRSAVLIIDGGGSAITAGIKGDLSIPFACTITGARLLADQVGSIVIDVWKDIYGNYPPTVADTITAAAKPTLAAAIKYEDTALTGWTLAIAAGDTLRFNVDSVATIERVTLQLTLN